MAKPYLLVRNDDPQTSHDSAPVRARHSIPMESRVIEFIRSCPDGCVSDNVLDHLGYDDQTAVKLHYPAVTSTYIALERAHLIERRGDTRPGTRFGDEQQVMRALPTGERERRLVAFDSIVLERSNQETNHAIYMWHIAKQSLEAAQRCETEWRVHLMNTLFKDVTAGEYSMDLGMDHILEIVVHQTKPKLNMKPPRKPRNKKSLA